MYISIVTLYVTDIDRAVDFYTTKLGWKKTMDVPMGEGRWVTVAPEGAQTELTLTATNRDGSAAKSGGSTGIVIEVDDVYKTHEQLASRGVEFVEQPRTEPWGGFATFKDSEGNEHGLHSNVPVSVSSN